MTLSEYMTRIEAYRLKYQARERDINLQAFLNQAVQSTKGTPDNPQLVYPTFNSFYDSQKAIDDIRSQFEPDYEPASRENNKNAMPSIEEQAKRIREWQALQAKKRKGGVANGKGRTVRNPSRLNSSR